MRAPPSNNSSPISPKSILIAGAGIGSRQGRRNVFAKVLEKSWFCTGLGVVTRYLEVDGRHDVSDGDPANPLQTRAHSATQTGLKGGQYFAQCTTICTEHNTKAQVNDMNAGVF